MPIFYPDPDGVQWQRRRYSPPTVARLAFPSARRLEQSINAWGVYDDAPDGAYYTKRRVSPPPPPARIAWNPTYRVMETLLAADTWNADPASWFYVKPKHPIPPHPHPFTYDLIPTILNLGQLQLQLNTLFAAIIGQLPDFGASLPDSDTYFDGKLFSVGTAVYQVQNGGWVRLI